MSTIEFLLAHADFKPHYLKVISVYFCTFETRKNVFI